MKRILATTALLLAVPLAAPAASPAAVVDCPRPDNTGDFMLDTVFATSARNMSCDAATRDILRHRKAFRRSFKTPGGFRCVRTSTGERSSRWRCTRRSRAYRFERLG